MKTSYTFTNLGSQFVLTDITNADNYIHINEEHPKFEIINDQGRNLLLQVLSQ